MAYQKIKGMMSDGKSSRYVLVDADGSLVEARKETDWIEINIVKGGTTSGAIDLGFNCSKVILLVPTIDSATTTIHVSRTHGGTYYPLHQINSAATGSFASATTAAVTSIAVVFEIVSARYLKVVVGAAQTTATRTFYVKGIN